MPYDEFLQIHLTLRRCRFIEHIADSSALVGDSRLSNYKAKQD